MLRPLTPFQLLGVLLGGALFWCFIALACGVEHPALHIGIGGAWTLLVMSVQHTRR